MSKTKDGLVRLYYGIGYYGKEFENVKLIDIPSYRTWRMMLQRCYDEKVHKVEPRYKDCAVCEEWHSLFRFNEWYLQNYYSINDERMELDKDILLKNNKIYSPDTCVFVPQRINTLFVTANKIRGEFPVGVYYDRQKKRYIANMAYNGKSIKVARCITPIEAFYEYKFYKECYIKEVAEEYKERIPDRLYRAMLKWEVEITD